jgi:hypothetical protein
MARLTGPVHFDAAELDDAFGRRPLAVEHDLVDHPLLTLDALTDLADRLPTRFVEHHRGEDLPLVQPDVDVEVIDATPAEVARGIRENGSWLVLWHVEQIPEYRDLLDETVADARALTPKREGRATGSDAFIFVSAPNTVTPAHVDPEHNLLLQITGTKRFATGRYPTREAEQRTAERYYAQSHRNLDWLPPEDQVFAMRPGTGVYVPYLRPHWVFNGPEVSISFSATFQTSRRQQWGGVHRLNGRVRQRGGSPRPPGDRPVLDLTKRAGDAAYNRINRILHGRELRAAAEQEEAATYSGPGGTRVG